MPARRDRLRLLNALAVALLTLLGAAAEACMPPRLSAKPASGHECCLRHASARRGQ